MKLEDSPIYLDTLCELAFADDEPGRITYLLTEAALEMMRLVDQEVAEHHSFTVCGACGRLYSREAWNKLPPHEKGLRRSDAWELQEVRRCDTMSDNGRACGTPLYAVIQIYLGQPLKGARRHTEPAPPDVDCSCCREPFGPGDMSVVRTLRGGRLQRTITQRFCMRCEEHAALAASLEVKK